MKKNALILILLLTCSYSFAQLAATNNGTLQINSGGVMFVVGNFNNNATGAFVNNGTLYVQGNLSNNQASIAAGSGTLYLNGTAAQAVGGTQAMRTNNLNTDNANGITLNNNLHVNGVHTFTNGIISTSSIPNYLVYEPGSSHMGSNNSNHVNGWVKKLGTTGFIFPVGNGTYLREIEIGSLSGASEFDARYSGTTPNTSNVASPLVLINPNEHWTLNKISGGTATVTLNWNQSKVDFPNYVLADIRASNYTASNWTNIGGSATGTVATSGSITSTPQSSFGALAIGSISFIVPLRLLSITASRQQDVTTVQWKTVSEEGVSRHEVQRSLTGTNFITIGQVAARNNQDEQIYHFDDKDHLTGTVYYRVRSVDIDGKVSYSSVVSLRINSTSDLKLVQNPVRERILIATTDKKALKFQYQLLTTEGKSVQQGTISYSGFGIISIPIQSPLSTGTYILQIKDNNKTNSLKMVVE